MCSRYTNPFNSLINSARCDYYSNIISMHKSYQKYLIKIVKYLLNVADASPYPDYQNNKVLADEFAAFFEQKVQAIRDEFNNQPDQMIFILGLYASLTLGSWLYSRNKNVRTITR